MTPEMNAQIAVWRSKALDGTLTAEEMKLAIAALREDRVGASVASEKSRRAKAKVAVPSADDLLSELGGM